MISNFNEVEKSLKRCLKEKISITTATVVGFLIAGTVAFGVDYTNDNFSGAINRTDSNGLSLSEDTNINGVTYGYKKGDEDTIKRLITVEGGKTTLDENTSISTVENITLLNIYGAEVENKGTLTNTNTGGMSTVTVNGFARDASFTNSGTITKEGQGGAAIDLAAGKSTNTDEVYTSTFTNTGTINGLIKSDKDGRQLGKIVINLKDSSKINGEFSFDGGGTRTINIDNNKDDLTINNTADNDTYVRTNNSDITLRGKIQSKGTTVELSNRNGNNTLTNYADIIGEIGIGTANESIDSNNSDAVQNREIKIINHGNITSSVYGIYNNAYATKYNKIYIENNGDILVNNFVKGEFNDKAFWYNNGIYSATMPQTITPGKVVNNGNITIELSDEQQKELEKNIKKQMEICFLIFMD